MYETKEMINKITFLTIFTFSLFSSCDRQDSPERDCINHLLEAWDMVPYRGQDTSDKFIVELYTYQGEQYFVISHPHIDIVFQPISCNEEFLCGPSHGTTCEDFSLNSELLGIVGISAD